jgi:RimJ/RimL family protein N-acetyltransferase
MPGPVFLAGDRITLRPAEQEDTEFLLSHINDPRVRATRTSPKPTGRDDVGMFLGGTMGRKDNSISLLICVDEEPVGHLMLVREKMGDETYDRGEIAFWVAPEHQGKGYATEAGELLVEYAFGRLGLHKLVAHAFEENVPSQRVIEKLGFTREGTLREEVYLDGDWQDYYRYGLLRGE